ncbi:MAG TPA: adenylate/guanylate cyclase domain-containing protein [Candidatus Binataceae bacterium]|nr:adenylate/guanylate cyclase domain-containing protein [Candidatus Binataceae bacterium]
MADTLVRKRPGLKFHWVTFFLGLGVTAGFLVFFAFYPRLLLTLELKASDVRLRARPHKPFSNDVAIVAIDDKSIQQIGRWPWTRDVLANLEMAFIDYKVKVVAYDILFDERDPVDVESEALAVKLRTLGVRGQQIRNLLGPTNDQQFADALKAQGRTILGYNFSAHMIGTAPPTTDPYFLTKVVDPRPMSWNVLRDPKDAAPALMSAGGYRPPLEIIDKAAKKAGFVDADSDDDGLFRREMTAINFNGTEYAPLFITALWAFEDQPQRSLQIDQDGIKFATLGNTKIPVDEIGRMTVTYQGPAGTIPRYSAADVINHLVKPENLEGKIAIVGVTGTGLGDRAVTPVGYEFPRVEIHANAIETVLSSDFIRNSPRETIVMVRTWTMMLGIGVSIVTAWLTPAWSIAAMLALAGSYLGFAQLLLLKQGVMLGVVQPFVVIGGTMVTLLGYRYVTEGRVRNRYARAFEHYLHPDIIASVVDNPQNLKLGGELRVLSILFADIVNYTGLSEKTDPVALVALLNDYMTKMTDLILESGGVVDKIRGDGIMAFWGAPAEVPNHARSAIEVALGMLSELHKLRERDPRFANIDIGIGIATGEAIAGNFGGANRFDYSVIGDTVNLAARLEGLTRQFKVHLLTSSATFTQAGGAYVARDIGLVKVKGKTQPVPIVEVVAHANDGVDPAFYQQFAHTLDLIKQGDAQQACREFERMSAAHPDDGVVGLYLEKLRNSPEQVSGEMVFEFESK